MSIHQAGANGDHRAVVLHGTLYGCRPFPEGGWCNIAADAYRPGTGYA